ncbi:MAG: VOC family protein [Halobacteriaceae archaeon]
MHADAIDHVNLSYPADKLDTIIDFYVDSLGFSTEFEDPYTAVQDDPGLFTITLGEQCKLFVNPTDDFDSSNANYRHMALRIPETPSAIRSRFDQANIQVENTVERHRQTIGQYTSFYVQDPVGYTIECMAIGDEQ